ncbi:MAG TPA: nicotinate-nucleotide--dimethylbenzimidazole phosphoribosyltransferase [Acidimicrobiales bacterium]
MPHPLPVDAVVFEPGALSGPGARRLVAALARAGATTAVVADVPGTSPRLPTAVDVVGTAAELGERLRLAAGRAVLVRAGDSGARAPARADAEADPGADAGADGPLAALPAVDCGDRPVHHALFDWLAGQLGPLEAARQLWAPLDAAATSAAEERHLRLTKPPGSLGRLETVGIQLAGIAAEVPPPLPHPAAVAVFAGDHGVHRQGVSPWPQEVTAQMVANFVAGGAAINVLARHAGAEVVVVDVGVATDLPETAEQPGPTDALGAGPRLVRRKVRAGTADLATGPAMTVDEARRALDVGAEVAADLVARGARCLVTGDMGIANTTPSSALIAALTGRPAPAVTGHGAGLDPELLAHKAALVEAAAARARAAHGDDPLAVLAEVGGLEHAALAGFVLGGAALQVPVVVDGVIAASALLVATRLVPGVEAAVVAGHRSVEPGSAAVLGALGLDPMVDLGLRLGEGTGAALALPLVEAAALILDEMATFDQAGVSDKGA